MERLCGVESISAVQRRFSDGLEVLKCMADFFKEIADIERHYANAVTRLMNSTPFNFRLNMVVKWLGADTYVEVGTLKTAWDKMGAELLKLAQVHAEKAEQYTTNVRQPLMECVPQMEELRKKLKTKEKTYLYNTEDAKKRHIREKQRYLAMSDQCSDIEKKINFMKEAPAAPPPVISRQESRLESLKKELGTLEAIYLNTQKEVERINSLVEKELVTLYKEAHEVELKRVNTIKGCLQTFTTSLSNTAPAYLEAMRQLIVCVDEIDGDADINKFVESHRELLQMQNDQPPPTSPPQPPPTSPPQPPPTSPPQPPPTSPPQPSPTSPPQPSLTTEQPSSVPSLVSSTSLTVSKSSDIIKMSDAEENTGAQTNSPRPQIHTSGAQTYASSVQAHPKPVSSRPRVKSVIKEDQVDGTDPTSRTGDEGSRHFGGSSLVMNQRTFPMARSPQANRKGTTESSQQRQANRTSSDKPAFRSPVVIESKVSLADDVDKTSPTPYTHVSPSADHRVKGASTLPSSTRDSWGSSFTSDPRGSSSTSDPRGSSSTSNPRGSSSTSDPRGSLPRPPKPPVAKKPELLHQLGGGEAILERVQKLAAENDYYGLLGLTPEATPEEMAKARRDKSKSLHPDHFSHAPPDRKQFAEKRLMLINQVYEDVLKTPDNRTLYDQLCKFRQHYHKVPHQSKNSLQQGEERLESLHRKMKKARLPLALQEEVLQALQLIRTTLQKSEQ